MINYSMLDTLNKEAFGADIDSLETLVINIKDSFNMGSNKYTQEQYNKFREILKELKPLSEAFKTPFDWVKDMEASKDKWSSDLKFKLCNFKRVCNINHDTVKDFAELLKYKNDCELIGYERVEASKFEAIYLFGRLSQARVLYRGTNGIDITKYMRDMIPSEIDIWEHEQKVVVYGDIFYSNPKNVYDNVQYCIRNCDYSNIKYYCYNLDSADSIWEAFENLEEAGFVVPEHAMIRGLCKDNYISYINQMLSNFKDGNAESVIIAINNLDDYKMSYNENYYCAEFEVNKHDYANDVYEAIVNEVAYRPGIKYMTPILIIKRTDINGNKIKEINGISISNIEKNNISIGSKINFRVNNIGEPHLCDEQGNLIFS